MRDDLRDAGDSSLVTPVLSGVEGRHSSPPADARWAAVCRLEDIVPNTGVCALVRGRQIAVFRLDDDSVYAIDNHDQFAPQVVASPVYKQHYSLVSGRCLEDPAVRVAVFPVRLEGGMVCVET